MPDAVSSAEHPFDHLYMKPETARQVPKVEGNLYVIDGQVLKWTGKSSEVQVPILRAGELKNGRISIGSYGMLTDKEAMAAVHAAQKAYNYGRGEWPRMGPKNRIEAMEKFVAGLKSMRDEIVELLMWEICKVKDDASKEVDRTITYIVDTLKALKDMENRDSTFITDTGVTAQIRRAPLGVVLCAGPFNYPFNETYTTLIPALLMGNTVVMKLPRVGVACHFPTFRLFVECFPKGVVNVISGSGRETMPPIMKSGLLDSFAFIGTSHAADELVKAHPKPHRLKLTLGLEAKNVAIVLPDADLDNIAVPECVLGSLSYCGMRCTAIKIIFVHESISGKFLEKFCATVDALPMGLPWENGVKITPLPEEHKPGYLRELVDDALGKGAKVANKRGNMFDRTFVAPTVLVNVNESMRVFHEEQFGPLVPVVSYRNLDEIFDYLSKSQYGQQAAIFGKEDTRTISTLIDDLVHQVARVNINSQCQRGPDTMPFTGRKDSAIGTLSVTDALRCFSIRSVVATKVDREINKKIVQEIVKSNSSRFLRLEHLF